MLSNKVAEIMTRDIFTADVSSSVFDVMQSMAAKDVGRAVITENGNYTGIFTEKDVLKRVHSQKLDPKTTNIRKVMTTPIRSVPDDTHIIDALGKMYRSKFRHLLVRERKGRIVGMVTMRRILELAVELGLASSVLADAAGDPFAPHLVQPAGDLVTGPAQIAVAPGPDFQHRCVILGADQPDRWRAQRGSW